jgi:hypothetical protein
MDEKKYTLMPPLEPEPKPLLQDEFPVPEQRSPYKFGHEHSVPGVGMWVAAEHVPTHMHEGDECPMCKAGLEVRPVLQVDSGTMEKLIAYQRADKNRRKRERRARRGK